MKRFLRVLLPILAIVIMCSTIFFACSKTIAPQEGIEMLKAACQKTLEAKQYYVRCSEGTKEYTLNVWPDKAETEYNDLMCKFVETDNSNILQPINNVYYFTSSLPASVKKEKNATLDQFKTAYFYTEKENDKYVNKYTTNMTFEEFLASEHVKQYTVNAIVNSIININENNANIISIVKVGNVTEYILKLKESISVDPNAKDLYEECKKNEKYGICIRITDGLISKVSITPLTNKNEIDNNEIPLFSHYISYVGPNLTFFGENAVPHYDEWKCVD